MSWEVHWTNRALKDLKRLDRAVREDILDAVDGFAETGAGDIRRLRGKHKGLFRLRVREWRVLFTIEPERTVLVIGVRARGDVYKR